RGVPPGGAGVQGAAASDAAVVSIPSWSFSSSKRVRSWSASAAVPRSSPRGLKCGLGLAEPGPDPAEGVPQEADLRGDLGLGRVQVLGGGHDQPPYRGAAGHARVPGQLLDLVVAPCHGFPPGVLLSSAYAAR